MEITVPASALYQMSKDIINAGMDVVRVTIEPPDDTIPDDPLPAALIFHASKARSDASVDFGEIEAVSFSD